VFGLTYDAAGRMTTATLPKTGALTIVAESGASLRLQYLRGDDVVKEYKGEGYTVGSGERSIIFKNLPPGRYKVVAELPGYTPATSAPVTVKAGGTDKVDLTLVQITYNVTIKLNAGSGTLTYAKGGEVSRSVRFQNGVAVLSGLTGGDYSIKIMPDDASYVQKDTNLRVSSDNQVSFDLDRLESKDFLGATASAWTLPNGWSFASGKVIVRGSGMALPSDSSYSHYQNFQLSTDVRMINGIAASFVVHVVDARNYYLVQITGPNADEPYVLRGFIVKGGVPQRFGRTIPTSQFSETLKPGKFFHVVLTMNDADITVRVQDSETGELLKLGILPDSSRTFRIGGVGIAAREGEQSEFSSFAICVSGCT
ncbi:MAG: hypothetical protein ACMG6H_12930, partial [Acidobacteriota bacterium]